MALAVDNFELLFKEIIKLTTSVKDAFALIGVAYTSHKLIYFSWSLYKVIKTHGVARFSHKHFKQNYGGDWAGIYLNEKYE